MATGMYIGINNVARKVKNAYVGINGVARKIKKGYIGVNGVARLFYEAKVSRLPNGYTEVEYIQGAGGSAGPYISTGTLTASFKKIIMDVEPTKNVTSSAGFFGYYRSAFPVPKDSGTNGSVDNCYILWNSSSISGSARSKIYLTKYNITPGPSYTISTDVSLRRMIIMMDVSDYKNIILAAGVDTYIDTGAATSSHAYGGTRSINLFSVSNQNAATTSGVATGNRLPGKLYSCKIYTTNEALINDFVPCIDPNGYVGLYDMVNENFKKSPVTAQFTAGPAV